MTIDYDSFLHRCCRNIDRQTFLLTRAGSSKSAGSLVCWCRYMFETWIPSGFLLTFVNKESEGGNKGGRKCIGHVMRGDGRNESNSLRRMLSITIRMMSVRDNQSPRLSSRGEASGDVEGKRGRKWRGGWMSRYRNLSRDYTFSQRIQMWFPFLPFPVLLLLSFLLRFSFSPSVCLLESIASRDRCLECMTRKEDDEYDQDVLIPLKSPTTTLTRKVWVQNLSVRESVTQLFFSFSRNLLIMMSIGRRTSDMMRDERAWNTKFSKHFEGQSNQSTESNQHPSQSLSVSLSHDSSLLVKLLRIQSEIPYSFDVNPFLGVSEKHSFERRFLDCLVCGLAWFLPVNSQTREGGWRKGRKPDSCRGDWGGQFQVLIYTTS